MGSGRRQLWTWRWAAESKAASTMAVISEGPLWRSTVLQKASQRAAVLAFRHSPRLWAVEEPAAAASAEEVSWKRLQTTRAAPAAATEVGPEAPVAALSPVDPLCLSCACEQAWRRQQAQCRRR